jgi:type II secretory pathway component PulK
MLNSDRRSGFTLPAVLAVTGVVTLVFLVAITALSSLSAEARSAKSRVLFIERALTAEAALAYLAATEPFNTNSIVVGGSREIDGPDGGRDGQTASTISVKIDGTPYGIDIEGPMLLQVQDQAGMINLSTLDALQWSRLGKAGGLTPELSRRLSALYADYTDMDDLRRVNGAESPDYQQRVPNRPFLRPMEWLSLLGVRDQVKAVEIRSIRDSLAADHTSPIANVNTATPEALAIVYGLNAQQIDRVVRARASSPFFSLQAFTAAAGTTTYLDDSERLYIFPSGTLVYTIRDVRSPWVYRARMALSPFGLEQPFWIDQIHLSEAPGRLAADNSNAIGFPYSPR